MSAFDFQDYHPWAENEYWITNGIAPEAQGINHDRARSIAKVAADGSPFGLLYNSKTDLYIMTLSRNLTNSRNFESVINAAGGKWIGGTFQGAQCEYFKLPAI